MENVCAQIRNGKEPGYIAKELLKPGTPKIYPQLKELFQEYIHDEEVPEEWKISFTTTFIKKVVMITAEG